MTLLILSIAVLIENFTIKELIEEAYKFIYKSLLENGNYLKSNNTENSLLPYISVSTKKKDKKKNHY